MTVLVVGGAGYIGSHAVRHLRDRHEEVVVIDNLETGHQQAIAKECTFYEGDIKNQEFLRKVFQNHKFDAVLHFAANSLVGESMSDPLKYYENNVYGTMCLLKVMAQFYVNKIVFSSTAAVYGEVQEMPIQESESTNPTNPYGETKLAIEKMLHWCEKAYGIHSMILRYFNVAGAHPDGTIGEDHHPETHLIPLILQVASGKRDKLLIYGDDYDTPDGTCIRDYIHINDLVEAHILALVKLRNEHRSAIYNLGNGNGFSVKEILDAAMKVTKTEIRAEVTSRRLGDPPILLASSQKAQAELGWSPSYTSVTEIIGSAWNWMQKNPDGYKQ
ncbi:UDP-glucose 4-epimerase GalE [Bacillus sp. CGMCC 1.16607]|uniref:UDP-glucose 4-epimerase GalE n=1 Tax=Bacillus sp. CGMCC 1.16607 TaxID=3351842 RepID=UPI003637E42A